ncbi:MAG: AMIN domain-containing protein [Gemmatimonadetes bacterium]|nr:AMIN domain-containing protein [Gemmatimonadota bacterium]
MRRHRTLAALAVGTLLISAAPVSAAPAPSARAAAEASAAVTAVRVVPGAGRADVVLSFEGTVDITDFTLESPHRIVVDVRGATMQLRAPAYDRVPRAGIVNVRVGQFEAEVVRLVLDLDAAREYSVVRGDNEVRVSVIGPDAFAPWSAGAAAVAADARMVAAPVAPAPSVQRTASVADVDRRLPAAPARVATRSFGVQQSAEPRINVSFYATPIAEVITIFSDFSGRTIITGSQVSGSVTAEIPGQPWDVALSKILQAQGLSAIEDSTGIITIDSYKNLSARVAAEPLVSQLVRVNYAKAGDMAVTIRELIASCSSGSVGAGGAPDAAPAPDAGAPGAEPSASTVCGRGTVAVEAKTNSLIITESVSRLPEIVSYVRDLDVRTPQVAIRAKIISVDRTATEELGLSYDVGTATHFQNALIPRGTPGEFTVNLGGDAFSGVANASRLYGSTSALSLIFNTAVRGYNFSAFVDALSSEQLSDVQAEPSTTTIDNRKATLFAGTEIAFLLTPPAIPGQIQAIAPVIQRQKVGISLDVTPHVTANRQISMEITATQQSLIGITQAGPSINERAATNEVLVGDGETAVIAGLTQTQVTKVKSGIPYLMNIPYIGRIFSQTRVEERKQDLLILVTPHIVDEGEVVGATRP